MPLKYLSGFTKNSLVIVFATSALIACGGGGGGGGSAAPAPDPVSRADTVAPVISLNGEATVTLQQGTSFVDSGATATDIVDGVVDATTTDSVGTAVGTYILTYRATDSAGNSSSVQRTVNVVANSASISAVDSSKWFHQTRLPNGSSWFNGEQQHYTDRIENAYVSNGTLKIVAKKERYEDQNVTKNYTSARLNSKYAFQYGTVEVRAKLPSGVGTWPAIWTLGKNINENGAYWQTQGFGTTPWPASGEIDIMEHWGRNENFVQSAIHTPSSSGGTVNVGGQTVATATSGFHVYKFEWTAQQLVFSVDNVVHYTYAPEVKDSSTWPFDAEQYLLLNFAIESSIYSSFTEDQFEIDYVRIYDQDAGPTDDPVWADEFGSSPIIDVTEPVISLNGAASVTIQQGATYSDTGATALDDIDSSVTVTTSGTVGTEPGTYTLTYTAVDAAGNSATATRTIIVTESNSALDTLNVIQNGAADVTWDLGLQAFDAGINYNSCENDGGADCPNIGWEVVTDPDRGDVLQVTHSAAGASAGFYTKTSTPVDARMYAGGNIIFDIKVVSGDSNISMKVDCIYPCTSGDNNLGNKGASGWETVTVGIDSLVANDLALTTVDTGIVIWATQLTSTVFQIDNVRWEQSANSPTVLDDGNDSTWVIPSYNGYNTPQAYSGYSLVWSDEFSGNALNQNNWTHESGAGGWGNNELQYYKPANTSVREGLLIIEAREQNWGGADYTSSRIKTQNKQSFRYGRIDIRAVTPEGQGLWPALWMLGENFASAGWPSSGEIDIMEMIGGSGRENTTNAHIWWSENGNTADYGGSQTLAAGETLASAFHVFSLVWTSRSITWYIDDVQFHSVDITPAGLAAFQEAFFFIFNVAVGGNWPGSPNSSTVFPQRMLVDYIRVFQQS